MIRWFLALFLALGVSASQAQFEPPAMLSAAAKGAPVCGPGDVASFAAWYGLNAYSCAKATALANAINVRRASDNTTQDVPLLSGGGLNIASANTFAGPDGGAGTCTASTSGSSTTLTISVCTTSATLHAGDTLTCSSCVQPLYIVSLGTFTGTGAGASGTVTLNIAQTISSQTVTSQVALYIHLWYDQSGNAITQTQATNANQAQLLPNCGTFSNSHPCSVWTTASSQVYSGTLGGSITQPFSTTGVAARTGNTSNYTEYLGGDNTSAMGWPNTTNTAYVASAATANVTATASDNATHSIQGVLNNTNSFIVVDGSVSAFQGGGGSAFPTPICVGTLCSGGINYMTGYIMSTGVAAGGFSSGQYAAIHALDSAYWGTP